MLINFYYSSNMHHSWEAIVWGLRPVNMIVRMNKLRAKITTENLNSSVSNDLIGIHVGLSTWSGLPDNKREVFIKFTLGNLICSLNDGLCNLWVETEVDICLSGGLFQDTKGSHNWDGHPFTFSSNLKVLERSLSLSTPIFVTRNSDRTKSVLFLSWLVAEDSEIESTVVRENSTLLQSQSRTQQRFA